MHIRLNYPVYVAPFFRHKTFKYQMLQNIYHKVVYHNYFKISMYSTLFRNVFINQTIYYYTHFRHYSTQLREIFIKYKFNAKYLLLAFIFLYIFFLLRPFFCSKIQISLFCHFFSVFRESFTIYGIISVGKFLFFILF